MSDTQATRQLKKKPADEVRRNMSAIRSTNTRIELAVRSVLWKRGYRFRKNDQRFPGKPDITFPTEKVAVFCDSDFWHGRDWELLKVRLQTNRDYWVPKIERNRQKDALVTEELKALGWTVIRIWESDIKKDPDGAVDDIVQMVQRARSTNARS